MATTAPTTRPALGRSVRANLSTAELYEDAIRHGEGLVAADGPLVVRTGKHTGRSPEDKFIVDEPASHDKIWWGPVNRPISEADYDRLRLALVDYLADRDLYSQDCFIGAAAAHRRSLRVYTETAWASIFARNLFRRPHAAQLAAFAPNFTIICVPSFQADPEPKGPAPGRRSSSTSRRMEIIIVGTEYAGEIKKSAFTVMNYLHARRGRAADALGHQRRPGRRPGGLLRPVGHGQDDAVGRPAAQPHRRRRARLGRRRHVQLRGRLLRQDDPPVADVRAGHLPDDAPLRDGPRERRPRPADARARPRFGAVHREHARRLPARLHRQRRRDRGRRARRGRSSS